MKITQAVLLTFLIICTICDALGEELDAEIREGLSDLIQNFGEQLFSSPKTSTGQIILQWQEASGVNPEEVGEYAEGDILFPYGVPKQRNGITNLAARWKKGQVPYVISGYFSYSDIQLIKTAFQEYARLTCVRFIPRTTQADYLDITSDNTGCWSSVGKIGGRQQLNLQTPGCLTTLGTVMHEFMHSLGFLHEQNRWERNRYVTIKFGNIIPGRENNFVKAQRQTTNGLGIEYDYRSVMHYSKNAFSVNGMPTIVPKVPGVQIGQRENLSRRDVKKIRRMYKCNRGVSNIYR